MQQMPKLAQVGKTARTLLTTDDKRYLMRDQNSTRLKASIEELNTLWDGPGWMPAEVRAARLRPSTDLSSDFIRLLKSITLSAQELDIPLPSLWDAGGALREAVMQGSNPPRLTLQMCIDVAKQMEATLAARNRMSADDSDHHNAAEGGNKQQTGEDAEQGHRVASQALPPAGQQVEAMGSRLEKILPSDEKCGVSQTLPPEDPGSHNQPHLKENETKRTLLENPGTWDETHGTVKHATSTQTPEEEDVEVGRRASQAAYFDFEDCGMASSHSSPLQTPLGPRDSFDTRDLSPHMSVGMPLNSITYEASESGPGPGPKLAASSGRISSFQQIAEEDVAVAVMAPVSNIDDQDGDLAPQRRHKKRTRLDLDLAKESSAGAASSPPRPSSKTRAGWGPEPSEVIRQLTTNVSLTDDVMRLVGSVIVAKYNRDVRLLDPLWFEADETGKVPQELRQIQPGRLLCFAIHHRQVNHWTLAAVQVFPRRMCLYFFDSLSNDDRAMKVRDRFQQWMECCGMGHELEFTREKCAQQEDMTSCGVYALAFLRNVVQHRAAPLSIQPQEERIGLLSTLKSADASTMDFPMASLVNELRHCGTHQPEGLFISPLKPDVTEMHALSCSDGSAELMLAAISLEDLRQRAQDTEARLSKALLAIEGAQEEANKLKIKIETINEVLGEILETTQGTWGTLRDESDDSGAFLEGKETPQQGRDITARLRERQADILQQLHQCTLDGAELIVARVKAYAATVETEAKETEARLSRAKSEKIKAEVDLERLKQFCQIKETIAQLSGEDLRFMRDLAGF
ncbi:hypothetical protein B0T10DRAFT_75002 [Thelonectria olida]|uniref:Ubiquitin-like protease family profile domain-containing protein n=1 Tax=Thelonectria olida TaxID=1576542 RepID=A0A9P8VNA2_9HYPO|nr:hypothetical protein B0T10DRAFT_75002 [Thelonectria olida]